MMGYGYMFGGGGDGGNADIAGMLLEPKLLFTPKTTENIKTNKAKWADESGALTLDASTMPNGALIHTIDGQQCVDIAAANSSGTAIGAFLKSPTDAGVLDFIYPGNYSIAIKIRTKIPAAAQTYGAGFTPIALKASSSTTPVMVLTAAAGAAGDTTRPLTYQMGGWSYYQGGLTLSNGEWSTLIWSHDTGKINIRINDTENEIKHIANWAQGNVNSIQFGSLYADCKDYGGTFGYVALYDRVLGKWEREHIAQVAF